MHGLEPQAGVIRHHRDHPGIGEQARDEASHEQAGHLLSGVPLEDQAWPHADHPYAWMLMLEDVQHRLHLGLVPRVEGSGDSGGGPALVDAAVDRPGRVCAHGRRVDEVGDACTGHRVEYAAAAIHVHRAQRGVVV